MARNEEKAQSMLYRFREAMKIEAGMKRNPNDATPLTPATCDRLPIAEQGRKEVLREISKKITRIQDRTLDEPQIRQLNDDLNKLVKEKYAWDARIHELGGIDRKSVQMQDRLGIEAPNVHGYLYFGRAKELPGVQEALQPHREEQTGLAKKRQELLQRIDQAYYGYDEDDPELLAAERAAEEALSAFNEPLADWLTGLPTLLPPGLSLSASEPPELGVAVPSQEAVQAYLLDRRKAALLHKLDRALL